MTQNYSEAKNKLQVETISQNNIKIKTLTKINLYKKKSILDTRPQLINAITGFVNCSSFQRKEDIFCKKSIKNGR